MIPQSISFIFFLLASVLSCAVFMGGYVMQHMQPNNKWRYVVYIASAALAILAGVFYLQTGLTMGLGASMVIFTGVNSAICLVAAINIKNK